MPGRCCHSFQIGNQSPHKTAGSSRVARRAVGIVPARPGDIEVNPGCRADELLEKLGRRDGASPLATNVLQVGHAALELLLEEDTGVIMGSSCCVSAEYGGRTYGEIHSQIS